MRCSTGSSQSSGETSTSRSSARVSSSGDGTSRTVGGGEKRRAGPPPSTPRGASSGGRSTDSNKRVRRGPAEGPVARRQVAALGHDGLLPAEDCLSSEPNGAAAKAEVSVDSEVDPAGASRVEAADTRLKGPWTTPVEDYAVKPELGFDFPRESKIPGGEL